MLGAICGSRDIGGKPVRDFRSFLLLPDQYRIDDNWHVAGLRGTGSKDIVSALQGVVSVRRVEQVYALYRDRWPIEQWPLSGKQMLGAVRQFVFAPECRQRLPELVLLAGSILSHAAATSPALPTGFWDRQPQATPGRRG